MNIVLLTILLFSQNAAPVDLFNQGNRYYEIGDYAGAIEAYEKAAQQMIHPALFYNLGNTYFKTGRMGKAILNFRRAFFLAPRDSDISFNLAFSRNYRIDKVKFEKGPFEKILFAFFHYFSMVETQYLTAILFLVLSTFTSLFVILRRDTYAYIALTSFLFCLFFFIDWQIWNQERNGGHAVVTVPEVSALSGPSEEYKEILLLHDGTEVKIQEKRGSYVLVRLSGGIGGWVPEDAVEKIFQ